MAIQFPTYTPDAAVLAKLAELEQRVANVESQAQQPTLVDQGYGSGYSQSNP